MFIVNLTYVSDLEKIDHYLKSHIEYLNEQYRLGHFIASGRKVPREGGIILSNLDDRNQLNKIIEKDPFKINGLAEYSIIEFIPSKCSKELEFLISN
ncbi:MAG: YciI family protein [Marinifilaceae bacterium]|jgi:uncharacterized protein YciI|nr:YciI family protein [Marinifilaceae bacterium]